VFSFLMMPTEKQAREPIRMRGAATQRICQARRIFIAYSHSDLRQAKDVHRRIVKLRKGLDPETVFLDQLNLRPGEDVSPAVIDAKLRDADLMVVLCGPDTPQRAEVQRELELGVQLRNQGVLTILPIILKTGVRLPAPINYSIQAIQLTTLFPEILWIRIGVAALTIGAILFAAIFAWRSSQDRQLAERVKYGSLIQRLAEQVDQELSPDNRNRNPERALLLARQAYDFLSRADSGHRAEVELALRKALAPFPPLRLLHQDSSASSIVDMRFSPDGLHLAAIVEPRLLLFTDQPSAQPAAFEAKGRLKAARFSPDGKIIAAVSQSGELCFWQTSGSGQQRDASGCRTLDGEPDIQDLAFHPATGQLLVALQADKKGILQHWDPSLFRLISAEPLPFLPSAVAIASDGQILLTATAETPPGTQWKALVNGERVDSLDVSPDGKRWVGLTPTGSIVFWRPGSPQSVSMDQAGAKAIAFDPKDEYLVTARTGSIEFHDIDFAFESMGSRATPCVGDNAVLAISATRRLAIACEGSIFLWDLPPIKELRNSPGKRTIDMNAALLVFHPTDPLRLAAAMPDGSVEVINVQTGDRRSIHRSECGTSLGSQLVTMGSAALDRDVASMKWFGSDHLIVAQKNGAIWTARADSKDADCKERFLGGRTCSFTLSADDAWQAAITEIAGRALLSIGPSKKSDGHQALDSSQGPVRCTGAIAFHPKNLALAGGANNELKLWTPASDGKWTSRTIEHFDAPLTAVAYSAQGDWLAAGGGLGQQSGYLWLWRTNIPKTQARLYTIPEAAVESLALSPQGEVAAGLSDGTVSLWTLDDLEGRPMRLGGTSELMDDWNPSAPLESAANLSRVLGPITVTPSEVDAMAAPKRSTYLSPTFNADGTLFAAVSHERIQILETDATSLAGQVCQLAPSNLTRLDWVRFMGAGEPYELTCPNRPVHSSVLAEADRAAAAGKDREALLLYREIRRLQGALGLDPDRRLALWKDRRQVGNNIKPDRERLVMALDAWSRFAGSPGHAGIPPLSFQDTLHLCRWSILLAADAKHALPVCESAVQLLPDMMAIDSRGMARALTGDWKGALSDFGKSADYLSAPSWRKEHAAWIEALQAGRNPITPDVLNRISADELSK
jgi:WD40 repeat protein